MDKAYAQKEDGWCGPAALSYALSQVGIKVTQEEIVKETKTTKNGVDPKPLIESAKKHGATVEIFIGDSPQKTLKRLVEAIRQGGSIIVDYLVSGDTDGGHYVVFLGRKEGRINIWNPSGGKKDLLDDSYFISNWRDRTEGGKILKNWAMVIRA
jgi:ABC-type bacteriocin/lantibiotic exporter with double-glycine peptidase domain